MTKKYSEPPTPNTFETQKALVPYSTMPTQAGWWILVRELNPGLQPILYWIENWQGDWMKREQQGGYYLNCERGHWFRLPIEYLATSVGQRDENQPAAPGKPNPSPSSAVADDVEAAREITLAEHFEHVGNFLNELYCTMIDPLAEGTITVKETCDTILAAARKDRETLANVEARKANVVRVCEALLGKLSRDGLIIDHSDEKELIKELLSEHGVSSPVGGVSYPQCPECKGTQFHHSRCRTRPPLASPPPSVEHVQK